MSPPVTFQLTEFDQRFLLRIARKSVEAYLAGCKPAHPEPVPEALKETRGVFVSLHQQGQLRGCIGNVHPVSPLYRSAAECAIAAAVGDPRFMPLMAAELESVVFEISVLSPLHRVMDIAEVEIGKHGLLVGKGTRQGLLLPQVATSHGWDRERFLRETCKKAGLSDDAWQDGASMQCFTAFVFGEDRPHFAYTFPEAPSIAPETAQ